MKKYSPALVLIFLIVLISWSQPAYAQRLIKDLALPSELSPPLILGEANQKLFFATGNVEPILFYKINRIWSTDGTAEGTRLLKEIKIPAQWQSNQMEAYQHYFLSDNKIFFFCSDALNQWKLWSSDGTEAGTKSIADFGDSVRQVHFGFGRKTKENGPVYYTFSTVNSDVWLGVTDGTASGTRTIKKTGHHSGSPFLIYRLASWFTSFRSKTYFIDRSKDSSYSLFVTDGSAAGTNEVYRFYFTNNIYHMPWLMTTGDKLLMQGYDTAGTYPIWESDGTTSGTRFLVSLTAGNFLPFASDFIRVNNRIFFIANTPGYGRELWKTDGTAAGTGMVADLVPGEGYGALMIAGEANGKVCFTGMKDSLTRNAKLFIADGTPDGTQMVDSSRIPRMLGFEMYPYPLSNILVRDGKIYFQNYSSRFPYPKGEIWVTDGTNSGTRALMQQDSLRVFPSLEFPFPMMLFQNRIYFAGLTSQTGAELHVIDSCICPETAFPDLSARLYPNPVRGTATIFLASSALPGNGSLQLLLYDAAGKRMEVKGFSINANCTEIRFETRHLPGGTYIASVLAGKKQIARKFIVLR